MNRRIFLKHFGYSLGGITFGSIINSCLSDDIFFISEEEKSNSFKIKIIEYLELSNSGYYEKRPEVFRQNRALLVVEEVAFLEDEKILAKANLDFILLIKTLGVVKSNFDFYRFNNKIIEVCQNDINIYQIKTDNPSDIITYVQFSKPTTLRFPVKILKNSSELMLDERYALPCIMNIKSFKDNFDVSRANTRNLNKLQLWQQ